MFRNPLNSPVKIYCLPLQGTVERQLIFYVFSDEDIWTNLVESRCDRDVVVAHRTPADGAPALLLLLLLLALLPGRSALPSQQNGGDGCGGGGARACQGQLTSVTFPAIHWLFADSGGAMMDCPARAADAARRPRRPTGGGHLRGTYAHGRRCTEIARKSSLRRQRTAKAQRLRRRFRAESRRRDERRPIDGDPSVVVLPPLTPESKPQPPPRPQRAHILTRGNQSNDVDYCLSRRGSRQIKRVPASAHAPGQIYYEAAAAVPPN